MRFANWVYQYQGHNSRERKAAFLNFIEKYKEDHTKAYTAFYKMIELGDLKVIGFCPEFYFISSEVGLNQSLLRVRFDSPALLLKHAYAPIFHVLFLKQTIEAGSFEDIFAESKRTKVRQCLKWAHTLNKATIKDKLAITRKILEDFRKEIHNDDSDHSPGVIRDFYDEFKKSGSMFQNLGFAVNDSYLKIKGSDLNALYVHPFGTPVLLYRMRSFPMYTMASPAIRLDTSVVLEGNKDLKAELVGQTG